MSIGMSRDAALEYVRQHPDEKCVRCRRALPASDGDDGIHEVLMRICAGCMVIQNQEIRDDMGGVCVVCASPRSPKEIVMPKKPATNEQIRRWLKPRKAERVLVRIEAAEARAEEEEGMAQHFRRELADLARSVDRAVEILNGPIIPDEPEPPTTTEHLPPDIHVPEPGNPAVLSFPITDRPEFTVIFTPLEDLEIIWDPPLDWPGELRPDIGRALFFGNSGIIYHGDTKWRAVATEWARIGAEESGTYYPLAPQFEKGGAPKTPGTPIGVFVAGLWRHTNDDPRHHRRTWVQWFDPETWERIEVPDFTQEER